MRGPSDAWRYYFKTLKTHWKQRKPWNNGSVRQTVIVLTNNFYLFPLDCSSCKFHRVQIRTQQERENARQVSKHVWLCLKCPCELSNDNHHHRFLDFCQSRWPLVRTVQFDGKHGFIRLNILVFLNQPHTHRPRRFRLWRHLGKRIALGSKPPLFTRIARTVL